MDEMIDNLTKGIGAELGRPLRIRYFETKKRLERNDRFRRCTTDVQMTLLDILALSLFNHEIILPFYGASNFQEGTKSAGVTGVRLGKTSLDRDFYIQASCIQKGFFAITRTYGLPVEQLHVSNLSDFVGHWINQLEHPYGTD